MIDKSEVLHNIKTGSDTDIYLSRINTDKNSANFTKIKTKDGLYKFPYLTRTTGNSLKPTTEFIQSNELRHGGAESAPRPGNTSVDGSIDVELSPITFDDNMCSVFNNEWKHWESDSDSASNLDKDQCAKGNFLTRACKLSSAGGYDENSYNDAEAFGQRPLINDGTNNGLLFVADGCVVNEMTFGKKNIEYLATKKYSGAENEDLYHIFKRLAIGTLDLNAEIGQIVTGSFGFTGDSSSDILDTNEVEKYLGKNGKPDATDNFEDGVTSGKSFIENLPEKAVESDQYTTREGDLWINGKNITFAESLSFNIDKNMEKKYALFVKNPVAKTSAKKAITVNLNTYLVPDSKELYNLANNNKTFEVLFAFEDKGYMNDSFDAKDRPENVYLVQIFNSKAEDKDLSASGEADYSMSIPLRSFGERLCRIFRIALPKALDADFVADDTTWSNSGSITIIPNVILTADDVNNMVANGKLYVIDTIKSENGTDLDQQTISSGFTVNDDGTISVNEAAWTQTVTEGKYREIEIVMNGKTLVKNVSEPEKVAPAQVSEVAIAIVNGKTEITWIDPNDEDFNHALVEIRTLNGASVSSDDVAKGVQKYTATLEAGDYQVDIISVDNNGNESIPLNSKFKVTTTTLNAVTNLTLTSDADTITASWTLPASFNEGTGVKVTLYGGTTPVTATVLKAAAQTHTFEGLDTGNYTVEAVTYKTITASGFTDSTLYGASAEKEKDICAATVTALNATASGQKITTTWTAPDKDYDGVRVQIFNSAGTTLIEKSDVKKPFTSYESKETLSPSTEYSIKATPYKRFSGVMSFGKESSTTCETEA